MHTASALTRRRFLRQTSVTTAAACLTAPWISRASPSASPNARLNLGVIGAGDRGSQLMHEVFAAADRCNAQITAICDVWRKNREAAAEKVRQGSKQSSGSNPMLCSRFEELLARQEIDAVIIATPDFSHAPILLAALEAGKDVYIEKPMTLDIDSANQALDLARAKHRVVQAGTQRRSDGHHRSAAKLIRAGALGKVNRISGAMNVNAARWARRFEDCLEPDVDWEAFCLGRIKRGFDPRLLRCWQLFRETTNGIPGLWMTHYADAVHLLMGAQYPASAVALGGTYVWQDGREHADTFHALLEYPEGFLFDWGMGLGNSEGIHFTVHGTKGTLDVEAWTLSNAGAAGVKAAEAKITNVPAEPAVGHMENWLQCVRSRAKPNADIEFGHQHAVATILTATAAQTGRRQNWNPVKRAAISA